MTRQADSEETLPATGLAETPGDYGFPAGARVGRYILGERLGAGGMGIVYAAQDPRLDRRVALKLLRPDASGSDDAHRQLVREAQTLARLAHPNVVNVHDIGDVDGRFYVDMELVKGTTLAAWLTASRRTWQDVLGVFIQAGRGLAAAHAVGIVHRDFKPDNVLVGDDGRVRVADFGIALLGPQLVERDSSAPRAAGANAEGLEDDPTAPPVARSRSGNRSISRTGTPAYMAPEQRRDGTADARSDQYSYCVALHEAMFGERPGPASSRRGREKDAPPRDLGPPAWLQQAIARGLSVDPAERYRGMEALLDVLVSEPKRRRGRRQAAATAAAAVALLGAGVVWGSVRGRASAPRLCQGAEAKLAGVWDEARKGASERAFMETGKPFAADAWRSARDTVDAYAREWIATRTEACEATRVRGEQSDQLLGLRMACLDDRLAAVKALGEELAHADGDIVIHAFGAAQALPSLTSCSDRKWLLARAKTPTDAETAAKVADLRARVEQLIVLDNFGKYAEALPLARVVTADASHSGDLGVQAAAIYMEGNLLGRTGALPEAEEMLRRAATAADAAGDDALRVRAWGTLLFFVVGEGRKFDLIPDFKREAMGAIARLGGDDDVEAKFMEDLGSAYLTAGKFAEAREAEEKAAALEAHTHGEDSWQEALALTNLGSARFLAGDDDDALAIEQRALGIVRSKLGPDHPFVAASEGTIAAALLRQGKPALAEPYSRHAVSIAEASFIDEELAQYFYGLGDILVAEGKLDEALADQQRALATIVKAEPGDVATHRLYLIALGETYLALGKGALGTPYLEKAVAIPVDGDETDMARAQFSLARALDGAHDARAQVRARALAREAKATLEASGSGKDDTQRLLAIKGWLATKPTP